MAGYGVNGKGRDYNDRNPRSVQHPLVAAARLASTPLSQRHTARSGKYGSGLNHMYAYVDQNPIMELDFFGLEADSQETQKHSRECKDCIGYNSGKPDEPQPSDPPSAFEPSSCYIMKNKVLFCCYTPSRIKNEYQWNCGRPPKSDEPILPPPKKCSDN